MLLSRIRNVGAVVAIFAASSALSLTGGSPALADTRAPTAVAAPQGAHQLLAAPFNCSPGKVILVLNGKGAGLTQLYSGSFGQGTVSFSPLGTPEQKWNATGYNPADGYFYGATNDTLLQINADGSVAVLGPLSEKIGSNVGTFDDAGNFWVSHNNRAALYRIDVSTREVTTLNLSGPIGTPDLTFAKGFLWGLGNETPEPLLHRVDLASGQVSTVPVDGIPSDDTANVYGAAFTYGNGRLGFYTQRTSALLSINVRNPGSANPIAKVVSTQTGPTSPGGSDGASCFTTSTDLQVTVDAPESAPPNTPIDYTLTVHNNGPAISSGWTLTNELPDNLSDASTDSAGCSIVGGVLTCTGGSLASGNEVVLRFTATGPDAGLVLNPATISGNEADSNPGNDSDSATTEIAPDAGTPMLDPPVAAGVIGAGALLGGVVLLLRRRRSATTTAV